MKVVYIFLIILYCVSGYYDDRPREDPYHLQRTSFYCSKHLYSSDYSTVNPYNVSLRLRIPLNITRT